MRVILVVSPSHSDQITETENHLLRRLRQVYGKPGLVAGPRSKTGPMLMGLTIQQEDNNEIAYLAFEDLDEPDTTSIDQILNLIIDQQRTTFQGRDVWIFAELLVIQLIRARVQNAPIGIPPTVTVLQVDTYNRLNEIDALPN